MECIEKQQVIPVTSEHLLFCTDATKASLSIDDDEFGDGFTADTNPKTLSFVLSKLEASAVSITHRVKLAENFNSTGKKTKVEVPQINDRIIAANADIALYKTKRYGL